jgi:8-oxo-dGTP diphosphatase
MTDFPISKQLYEQKVRVRACGILIENDSILLLRHENVGKKGFLWAPPGGGVDFGVSAEQTVINEFWEETNLKVSIEKFLFVNEFIGETLHSIELFFQVKRIGGELKLGKDPEVPENEQILSAIKYMNLNEINSLDSDMIHNSIIRQSKISDMLNLNGLITLNNN